MLALQIRTVQAMFLQHLYVLKLIFHPLLSGQNHASGDNSSLLYIDCKQCIICYKYFLVINLYSKCQYLTNEEEENNNIIILCDF